MEDRFVGAIGTIACVVTVIVVAHSLGVRRSPTIQRVAVRLDAALPKWLSELLGITLLLGTSQEEQLFRYWRQTSIMLTILVASFMTVLGAMMLRLALFGN